MLENGLVMAIKLPVDVSFISEPIVSPEGGVFAFEILSRFSLPDHERNVLFPTGYAFKEATKNILMNIFTCQVESVMKLADFFSSNNFLCTLNVNDVIANFICNTPEIERALINIPFIRLEISEQFTELMGAAKKPVLSRLSRNFGLWLDDFGSGSANLAALQSGLFETVKIDKTFFWNHAEGHLWESCLREIKRYTTSVVVEGVETEVQAQRLRGRVEGIQGYLFPGIPLSDLPHAGWPANGTDTSTDAMAENKKH